MNPVVTQMTATEGSQVGFSNGGSVSQTLADTLMANTLYTLNVDFLARKDCCPAFGTQLQLMAGSTVLATFNGAALATGAVRTDTLTFSALSGDPNLGRALGIVISTTGSGSQLAFDNVRLTTVVPEPATFGLFGGAFGLLLIAARYRKSTVSPSA